MMLILVSPSCEGDVLGQDGDAALALEVVGVEDQAVLAALELLQLAGAEQAGLAQHLIDQGRLAVVDVGDDGHVANIGAFHAWISRVRRSRVSGGVVRNGEKPIILRASAPVPGEFPAGNCGDFVKGRARGSRVELYLIRHADAEPLTPALAADDERPLTAKGLDQCEALAAALLRGGVQLDKIVTSPLVRARQTAERLLQHWKEPLPELVISDALAPHTKAKKQKRFF